MGKAKKRVMRTIGMMLFFTIIVLLFYYYWVNRVTPVGDETENLTENEKLIAEDWDSNYPPTAREVVKTFARIMKALYSNPEEEEIRPLAMKIRELYDEEFLAVNPENTYLTNLITDIAGWQDKNRKITNFLLANEDKEQESEVDGVKYSVNYVSFTIQENVKFVETWKVLLRQDAEDKWKILGWEYAAE